MLIWCLYSLESLQHYFDPILHLYRISTPLEMLSPILEEFFHRVLVAAFATTQVAEPIAESTAELTTKLVPELVAKLFVVSLVVVIHSKPSLVQPLSWFTLVTLPPSTTLV